MRAMNLALLMFIVTMPVTGSDDTITYCPTGPFADCTEAQDCRPGETASGEDAYLCRCPLRDGESVTSGGCDAATDDTAQSRYPGVLSMGVCTSATNEWADCLGVPCQGIDGDSSNVECTCNVARSKDLLSTQYVIVGVPEDGAAQVCASDMHNSSATPGQVFAATSVLRSGRAQSSGATTLDPALSWVFP